MKKIILKKEECISCGSCAAVCPTHFKMDDDNMAEIVDGEKNEDTGNIEKEVNDVGCAEEAKQCCPVQCIYIK